jgi:outer membrane protein TolC
MNDLPPAIEPPRAAAALDSPRTPGSSLPFDPDAAALDAVAATGKPLTLPEAIALAFRAQPRLRAQLESIEQARGRQGIAYSAFLPTAGGIYHVGGLDVHVAAPGHANVSAFTFVPPFGAVPAGVKIESGYERAEFQMQWLILDFGRRLGQYEQAKLSADVARLQTDRAFQTVANEVSVAYYGVLRAQALRRTAEDAARRAIAELGDARKLELEYAMGTGQTPATLACRPPQPGP